MSLSSSHTALQVTNPANATSGFVFAKVASERQPQPSHNANTHRHHGVRAVEGAWPLTNRGMAFWWRTGAGLGSAGGREPRQEQDRACWDLLLPPPLLPAKGLVLAFRSYWKYWDGYLSSLRGQSDEESSSSETRKSIPWIKKVPYLLEQALGLGVLGHMIPSSQ